MLGLGSYESSDDESASASGKRTKLKSQQTQDDCKIYCPSIRPTITSAPETPATTGLSQKPKSPIADEATSTNETPIGPMVGPVAPSDPSNLSDSDSRGQSPYSASRSLIRDLTLPPVPNLDIPPSPPGSPQPSTSAKFAHFLELKKQGVHFNEKLAKSSALKNPSLLQKLMGFAGIDDQNQYASTLPTELWDPSGFPKWAYKEELAKSQQELSRRKEEEKARVQREALEFVPATGSGESTRVGTPGSGNPRDDVYGAYDASYLQTSGPKQHTQSPIVTGTSVVALKFKDGVVIAADNLASYGSLARFTDVKRLRPFNARTILGFGGDVSDMQYIDRLLTSLSVHENYSTAGEAHDLNAKNVHSYMAKVLYKRRSDFNPLWNQVLVAGLDADDAPFLASADLLGTTFSAPSLATGFGAHLAQPILRRYVPDDSAVEGLSREQAVAAVKECMKVLFYRDARSLDRYSIAVVTKEGGVELKEDELLEKQSWAFAESIKGYGSQVN
ncbi:MAG: hypothetical protein M1819_002256 [Sarea resinae]|nr:MAG: hypothetical protein M1819_002256 [Sarea resinae]